MAGCRYLFALLLLIYAGEISAQEQLALAIDLGQIAEDGGAVEGEVRWINKGQKAMVITRSTVDCGCLKIETTNQPIAPKGEVVVKYSYNGKGYPGTLSRRAMIYGSNGEVVKVEFSGYVEPSSDMSKRFPFVMGEAFLKQEGVSFSVRGGRQVERILAYNNSGRKLKISAIKGGLPEGITLKTEREIVEPKSEFDIVISYDPTKFKGEKANFKVIMDGLTTAPSKRSIEVRFK